MTFCSATSTAASCDKYWAADQPAPAADESVFTEVLHELNQVASPINHLLAYAVGSWGGAAVASAVLGKGLALTACTTSLPGLAACSLAGAAGVVLLSGTAKLADGERPTDTSGIELAHQAVSGATGFLFGCWGVGSLRLFAAESAVSVGVGRLAAVAEAKSQGAKAPFTQAMHDGQGWLGDISWALGGQLSGMSLGSTARLHLARGRFFKAFAEAIDESNGSGSTSPREAARLLMQEFKLNWKVLSLEDLNWFVVDAKKLLLQIKASTSRTLFPFIEKMAANSELEGDVLEGARLRLTRDLQARGQAVPPFPPKMRVPRDRPDLHQQTSAGDIYRSIQKAERWLQEITTQHGSGSPSFSDLPSVNRQFISSVESDLKAYLDAARLRHAELIQALKQAPPR